MYFILGLCIFELPHLGFREYITIKHVNLNYVFFLFYDFDSTVFCIPNSVFPHYIFCIINLEK